MKTGRDKYGFSLYYVYFTGTKRGGLNTNFLVTYNGRRQD